MRIYLCHCCGKTFGSNDELLADRAEPLHAEKLKLHQAAVLQGEHDLEKLKRNPSQEVLEQIGKNAAKLGVMVKGLESIIEAEKELIDVQ